MELWRSHALALALAAALCGLIPFPPVAAVGLRRARSADQVQAEDSSGVGTQEGSQYQEGDGSGNGEQVQAQEGDGAASGEQVQAQEGDGAGSGEQVQLQEGDGAGSGGQDADAAGAAGMEQQDAGSDTDGGLKKGSRVLINGLRNAVELNGVQAQVQGYDEKSGRYIVKLPGDGKMKKLKAENLIQSEATAEEKHEQAMAEFMQANNKRIEGLTKKEDPNDHLGKGTKVMIDGLLKSPQLNGQIGTIRTFDFATQRYVVQVGAGAPRRIRPGNLQEVSADGQPMGEPLGRTESGDGRAPEPQSGGDGRPPSPGTAASICKSQLDSAQASNKEPDKGPSNYGPGTKVKLQKLSSPSALQNHLNGQEGVVHCFDTFSGRYVVLMPDGKPRKLKPQNLATTAPTSVCEAQLAQAKADGANAAAPDLGPSGFAPGTNVTLLNLTSAAAMAGHWNGMTGVVHCFDPESKRYVVATSDGTPRKLKPQNLGLMGSAAAGGGSVEPQDLVSAGPGGGAAAGGGGGGRARRPAGKHLLNGGGGGGAPPMRTQGGGGVGNPTPRLSLCNAYPAGTPLQVFAVDDGEKNKKKKYRQVAKDVGYQQCADVVEFPFPAGSLSFVVGRFQVSKIPVNLTKLGRRHGLEMTVYRSDVNSLKATVHSNVVDMTDARAYHLHVINAYAGSRLLELHVKRGNFLQKLPLNSSFRLSREQQLDFTLTDGFQKLHLGFQPHRARTYAVLLTGVDAGLRGEPRTVGMVAHELGTWTSSEEMPQQPTEGVLADKSGKKEDSQKPKLSAIDRDHSRASDHGLLSPLLWLLTAAALSLPLIEA